MNEFIAMFQGVDALLIGKAFVFFICGLFGMIAAYSHRWARDKVPVSWWCYMTGDKHEMGLALTKLAGACWVAGGFDYLEPLSLMAIVNAGVLIGMTIPDKVDEDKAKQKQASRQSDFIASNKGRLTNLSDKLDDV